MKYIYTVSNVGPNIENTNSLSIALSVNIKYLTYALYATELVPVDDVVTTEIVSIDICQEEKFLSGSTEVYATLPIVTICDDTAVYEFGVEKGCDV